MRVVREEKEKRKMRVMVVQRVGMWLCAALVNGVRPKRAAARARHTKLTLFEMRFTPHFTTPHHHHHHAQEARPELQETTIVQSGVDEDR